MKLNDYLNAHGIKRVWLAEKIGYHRVYLASVMNGTYKPSESLIKKVEEFTNGAVTAKDWVSKKERMNKNQLELPFKEFQQ